MSIFKRKRRKAAVQVVGDNSLLINSAGSISIAQTVTHRPATSAKVTRASVSRPSSSVGYDAFAASSIASYPLLSDTSSSYSSSYSSCDSGSSYSSSDSGCSF